MKAVLKEVFLLFLCLSLVPDTAHAVVMTIVNDLSPEEAGAILEITNVKGIDIPPNLRVVLNPGQSKRLTIRNVYTFTVSRVFGDEQQKFVVSCPKDPRIKDKITLRLVDIQSNSMPAGCLLERTGKWTRSDGTQWDRHPITSQR